MGTINAAWHRAHPMPKNPTLDQRVEWHMAHARACGCRAIHGTVLAELRRRGIAVPVFQDKAIRREPGKPTLRSSRRR